MVRLDVVKAANLEMVKKQPIVAVVAGGTSGIGEYTIRALATTHAGVGQGLRLYIVGRSTKAAEIIIADCRRLCSTGQFIFVKADDLSLLKDVDTVCAKLIEMERREAGQRTETPKIDFLVMTQACSPLWPWKVTSEGLERLMSLLYYSRMRMITKLLPLLLESSMPCHVLSVYAGGMEGKLIRDDLSLRNAGQYSLAQARSHVCYMTTLFMEDFARKHPGKLSLTHVFPSLVITPTFEDPSQPLWFRLIWNTVGKYLAKLIAVDLEESGTRMLSFATPLYPPQSAHEPLQKALPKGQTALGTDGFYASGAYAANWNGECINVAHKYEKLGKEELSKRILDHTNHVFKTIEAGEVFKP